MYINSMLRMFAFSGTLKIGVSQVKSVGRCKAGCLLTSTESSTVTMQGQEEFVGSLIIYLLLKKNTVAA
jgi:hypothetical protein